MNGNSHMPIGHGSEKMKHEEPEDVYPGPDSKLWHLEASDEESTKVSDSKTILGHSPNFPFYSVAFRITKRGIWELQAIILATSFVS